MPKFYVDAGHLRIIINRETPKQAAIDAFKTLEITPVKSLCEFVVVSEKGFGFDNDHPKDWWFNTADILEQSGLIGLYKPDNWF